MAPTEHGLLCMIPSYTEYPLQDDCTEYRDGLPKRGTLALSPRSLESSSSRTCLAFDDSPNEKEKKLEPPSGLLESGFRALLTTRTLFWGFTGNSA